mmetsp:Transcript_62963/g.172569  ORF Transcript_62963/g.172569 Transcript_62963/m.172569 type:complete len:231 (+) Transcript_62963:918-1610(+)
MGCRDVLVRRVAHRIAVERVPLQALVVRVGHRVDHSVAVVVPAAVVVVEGVARESRLLVRVVVAPSHLFHIMVSVFVHRVDIVRISRLRIHRRRLLLFLLLLSDGLQRASKLRGLQGLLRLDRVHLHHQIALAYPLFIPLRLFRQPLLLLQLCLLPRDLLLLVVARLLVGEVPLRNQIVRPPLDHLLELLLTEELLYVKTGLESSQQQCSARDREERAQRVAQLGVGRGH